MINQVYRLVSPRQFEVANINKELNSEQVVIKPTYLAICHADQRYFNGSRDKKTMKKKLPMALIHEGVGEVVYDSKGEFKVGTSVVMIPNTPAETDSIIAENYLPTSKFRSSGYDGFMQDYVFLGRDRVIEVPKNLDQKIAAITELISISTHAITRFESRSNINRSIIGVWGDGNLGYLTALLFKRLYSESKVYVFGKNSYKLDYFSFVDETFVIDEVPESLIIDHAFECVGGIGSKHAINQIIDLIRPEGTISLLGVTEDPIEINTRMVLEKGLNLYGSSRSGHDDFQKTIDIISKDDELQGYLDNLMGHIQEVRDIDDIIAAFEADMSSNWGKTILHWKI